MTAKATLGTSRHAFLFVLACVFITLAVLNSNTALLAPAFVLLGISGYTKLTSQPAKVFLLVACGFLALASIGYKLGKDAALRDNAKNCCPHTEAARSNNSFKPNPLRGSA